MQVTQTSAEGLKHEFKIVVPAGQIADKVLSRLNEVGRTVNIPGFRPGKVPIPLLRKRFGSSVMSEVVEEAVNDGARHAIDEHKLRPALRPQVNITSTVGEDKDLEFTVAVEALPEVQVMDLAAIAIERPTTPVAEAEVEDALKNIAAQRDQSEALPAAHAAKDGEIAVIDFLGKIEGQPFDGGKGEAFPLRLGSGSFVPGFEQQLVGAKAGEDRLVKITFPEDFGSPNLAGKDAEFEVKVKEVRRVVPTALDDALAKMLGHETLDSLRTAVRAEIDKGHAQASRTHAKRRLLDALAAGHSFDLPAGMVDLEFEGIWSQVERERQAGRLDPEDAGKSEDELKAEYRSIAERRVRLGLVIAEIGKRNNIAVSQQDLSRAMANEARRFPGQEHLVVQYFQKNPQAVEGLRAPIFEEKVVDFILELAKVTDKEVLLDELRRDPDAPPAKEAEAAGEEEGEAAPKAKAKKKPAAKPAAKSGAKKKSAGD